jgi:CheY-like chemotaxis protein
MARSEHACVFTRPSRERLVAAERLVRALPDFLPGAVAECDLHHARSSRYLAVIVRAEPASLGAEVRARLDFWTARSGGSAFAVGALSDAGRERLLGELNLCEKTVKGIPIASVPEAVARLLRPSGSPAPQEGPPRFAIDPDGPGHEGLAYVAERMELFVATLLAPPVGDRFVLSVRVKGQDAPLAGWVTVAGVVARAEAAAGRPAGFSLRVEGPTALHALLSARIAPRLPSGQQAAPRFAVKAPVTVTPAGSAAAPSRPAQTPAPHARIEYATEQELAADWIENLSHGGAFVRTANPRPPGSRLVLDLALPDGARLSAQAVVTAATAQGMGVRFVLGPDQDALLASAIARISARPRRVLVVDDDALARQMLGDALTARGFEVISAADGAEGIQRLSEEILALDLLVTDVCMPGMSGEELVRFIRKVGGEADLTIVAVTGRMEPDTEPRLSAAGADAVLDKALGPEHLAGAADAALERRRMGA